MKIRTDFVTNSSSSSFAAVRINLSNGCVFFKEPSDVEEVASNIELKRVLQAKNFRELLELLCYDEDEDLCFYRVDEDGEIVEDDEGLDEDTITDDWIADKIDGLSISDIVNVQIDIGEHLYGEMVDCSEEDDVEDDIEGTRYTIDFRNETIKSEDMDCDTEVLNPEYEGDLYTDF